MKEILIPAALGVVLGVVILASCLVLVGLAFAPIYTEMWFESHGCSEFTSIVMAIGEFILEFIVLCLVAWCFNKGE